MKQQSKSQRWLLSAAVRTALAALLLGGTNLTFAQTPDLTINSFDVGTSDNRFGREWGPGSVGWDEFDGNPAGSLAVTNVFGSASDTPTTAWICLNGNPWWVGTAINFSQYKSLQFDIKWDNTSDMTIAQFNDLSTWDTAMTNQAGQNVMFSWAGAGYLAGSIRGLEVTLCGGAGGQMGPVITNVNIPAEASSGWAHITIPINPAQANIDGVSGIVFHKWIKQQWGIENPATARFWIDNVMLEGTAAPPPPPTMHLALTSPGLQLISTTAGGANARYSVRTASPSYSWINSPTPTVYSVTIKDYAKNPYNYFQTHMFLIPSNSLPYGAGDSACDWNSTNAIFVSIQNTAAGGGYARFMWKSNVIDHSTWGPNQVWNRTNPPIPTLSSARILGTWSLTFDHNTNVTFKAPDNTTTSFKLPADAIPWFTDANGMYFYVGVQPNGAGNVGQSAVMSEISVTGAVDGGGSPGGDISDTFPAPPLDTGTWGLASSDANGVQVVASDTPFWLLWTLPAGGYSLEWSSDFPPSSGWLDPGLTAIDLGSFRRALIPIWLSSANTAFFHLYNPTLDTNSLNTVGYQRFDLAQGSNQVTIPMFKMDSYQIGDVLPTAYDGAYVASPTATNSYTFPAGWTTPNMFLPLGATFEFNNPYAAIWEVTFVGDVVPTGPPVILLDPVGATNAVGDNIRLTSMAGGDPTLQYQWRHYGTNLDGATDCTLSLANIQQDQAGPYTVRVANGIDAAISAEAQLVVQNPAATLNPVVVTNGTFGFQVTGFAGRRYVVERNTSLSGTPWTPVHTNQAPFWFSEPASTSEHRLYRAVY